jgi:SsrA-binding protein
MSARETDSSRYTEIRNAKARHDYFVEEKFEAGLALKGTEVKSIRAGRAQIADAFGRFEKGELWLINAHIDTYSFASTANHEPRRSRKLLLHTHQIRKIAQALAVGGTSLIPLRMYFKGALVKVEVALCTGKKSHDKRETLKQRVVSREIDQEMKNRRR